MNKAPAVKKTWLPMGLPPAKPACGTAPKEKNAKSPFIAKKPPARCSFGSRYGKKPGIGLGSGSWSGLEARGGCCPVVWGLVQGCGGAIFNVLVKH